jgi:hypothetical protein
MLRRSQLCLQLEAIPEAGAPLREHKFGDLVVEPLGLGWDYRGGERWLSRVTFSA